MSEKTWSEQVAGGIGDSMMGVQISRISVPEGGLKAGMRANRAHKACRSWYSEDVTRTILEGFIRWLDDNLPKARWIDENQLVRESYRMGHDDTLYDLRRMFLVPEPEFDATLGGALLGRTWTQEQADALILNIQTATHGYRPH